MVERRLIGRMASPGFASGPLVIVSSTPPVRREIGDPSGEARALRDAIGAALEQLARLVEDAETDGADILSFQIAMLEDDALTETAFRAISAGARADLAWRASVDREIHGYETADDENFRARASDLRDIRDRVLTAMTGDAAGAPPPSGAIVAGKDLTPSRFLAIDWRAGGGVALTRGSASGHVATLAKARGVPMIVGLPLDLDSVSHESDALIDARDATLFLDPEPATREQFAVRARVAKTAASVAEEYRARPAFTADGARITVCLNIADPAELETLDPEWCDGIGLVRTEFLFTAGSKLPDEETQYRIYRRLAEWAAGKPVTIRTLDAGADKPIPGLTLEHESNPFLGLRGVRLSLARQQTFAVQLRALCRAAAHGAIEVMLPMVAVPSELERARAHLDEALAAVSASGAGRRRPDLGVMVEVPAAAISVEAFDAAFFSIGSNDLTQYVMAAARDNDAVAELNDPSNPAVLHLIARVAAHGRATQRKVSLCGDAGGDPKFIGALLAAGLRSLSVSPAALGRTKEAIARIHLTGL